jgi:hypothetical protein
MQGAKDGPQRLFDGLSLCMQDRMVLVWYFSQTYLRTRYSLRKGLP